MIARASRTAANNGCATRQQCPGDDPVKFKLPSLWRRLPVSPPPHRVAQDAETEKAIEKYRADAEGGPVEQSRTARCRSRRSAVDDAAGPKKASLEQCDLGKGPGQGRRRLRRAAALFRRRRPGDGSGDPHPLVHGEAAGITAPTIVKRPASRRRAAGEGLGAIATYVASKSARQKFAAPPSTPKERDAVALGETLFFRRSARSISPARPATPPMGLRIRLQGLAASVEHEGGAQGGRGMAGLPRVDHPRDDDAAPALRLLLADAHAGAADRLGGERCADRVPDQQAAGGEIAAPGLKR